MDSVPQTEVVDILNKILEIELAGVVRYTHYSLMVFGHARIPIVSGIGRKEVFLMKLT